MSVGQVFIRCAHMWGTWQWQHGIVIVWNSMGGIANLMRSYVGRIYMWGAHICDEGHGVVAAYLRNGSRGVEALA